MSKVWFVTGSSRGLGRSIAEAVLAAGDSLLATARDPQRLDDLVEQYGDRIRTAALDVTDPRAAREAVQVAVDAFGRLDVVVNNAGYGEFSPFEQTTEDDFRAQIDTNFYGVVNVTRAAVPILRRQRSGHIIQVSSVGGRVGNTGMTAYQAAKWAVGGFSEALRHELAPIGVKVTVLEPGGMKTEWRDRAMQNVPEILPDYEPAVNALMDLFRRFGGGQFGDPARVAALIVRLAGHENPPLHLLIGSDALQIVTESDAARAAIGKAWQAVTVSTDFGASEPIPALPG
jgi:NAD(P)-dependent dehydrogenase (short-subunit alcohol dehydrogenase family)